MNTVQVGSYSIAYRESGSGPPLLLLHGFLCDSRCWRTQLDGLSERFRVVAWDAPGAGESSDPPETFTMSDWSRSLGGFMDALGIDTAHIVGLSWGGVLAQEFYRMFPERFSGLVLTDTYAGWKGSLPPKAVQLRVARCEDDSRLPPEEFTRRWVPEMFTDGVPRAVFDELAGIIADFHPHGFRLMARSLADTDTTDVLPTITVPTLVLWGDTDKRSPIGIAEQLRDGITNAEYEVIPNCGHLSNMEQPEAFNRAIRRFLEEV